MLEWWGPRIFFEYYAATEGGGTLATPQDWLARPGTVGTPWQASEIMITGDDGQGMPARHPRHRLHEDGHHAVRVQGRPGQDGRRTGCAASSPPVTSATSTRTGSCSSATARPT